MSGEEVDQRARDSVAYLFERHYTWNTNLVLQADSINLVALPLKESYSTLRQGDHVVVAELDVHPNDSVDSIWVKLAHSQEVQGWVRECEMKRAFVPADSISQAIYLFSDTHVPYFIVICALFVAFWLIRMLRRKSFSKSGFGDIDYVYPLLLCLLMAFCATLYETMQVFVPDTWEHFYYNPTLSPFRVPLLLSLFLSGLWIFVVVLVATVDVLFRRLPLSTAVFYLLGLASACIFCYFFFILTTGIYVGYVFLALLAVLFVRLLRRSLHTSVYRCGNCGEALAQKGVCPYCGALNE
ncbi:MAG: hypothetical protein H9791_03770 [Candidatus Bacteroides intestinipullorum]|uniref:Zinc ribbon domain-containing protein n=1 Tax=Candidatus Bacteroides intestinipullorum TaxID=2838471 RepID=A0A9E2KFS3_9BACE|nr:hypothetical protein [Candidatus Bacteroides intestinipullorum]